jgi:hypothetical protein
MDVDEVARRLRLDPDATDVMARARELVRLARGRVRPQVRLQSHSAARPRPFSLG